MTVSPICLVVCVHILLHRSHDRYFSLWKLYLNKHSTKAMQEFNCQRGIKAINSSRIWLRIREGNVVWKSGSVVDITWELLSFSHKAQSLEKADCPIVILYCLWTFSYLTHFALSSLHQNRTTLCQRKKTVLFYEAIQTSLGFYSIGKKRWNTLERCLKDAASILWEKKREDIDGWMIKTSKKKPEDIQVTEVTANEGSRQWKRLEGINVAHIKTP